GLAPVLLTAKSGLGGDPSFRRLEGALASQLDLLLASGGGSDIWPDPVTQRTPLGTHARPRPTEIWFGATGPSSIGQRGYRAALQTLDQLIGSDADPLSPTRWVEGLRLRIAR